MTKYRVMQKGKKPKTFTNIKDIVEYLGVSKATVHRWIKNKGNKDKSIKIWKSQKRIKDNPVPPNSPKSIEKEPEPIEWTPEPEEEKELKDLSEPEELKRDPPVISSNTESKKEDDNIKDKLDSYLFKKFKNFMNIDNNIENKEQYPRYIKWLCNICKDWSATKNPDFIENIIKEINEDGYIILTCLNCDKKVYLMKKDLKVPPNYILK